MTAPALDKPTPALLAHHLEQLRASGISDSVIAATGYFSVTKTAQLVGYGWGNSRRLPALLVALAVPVHPAANGSVPYVILRPDNPLPNGDGKPRKYECPPKSSARLDVNPGQREHLLDPTVRLWLCEGAKKRDALVSVDEFAIAVAGVWNWKSSGALADLDAIVLRDRDVVIAFDSDLRRKPGVRAAARRLGNLLTAKGARVQYLELEDDGSEKIGVDDHFGRGGTLAELEQRLRDDVPGPAPISESECELNDTGNARRFVRLHGADVRFVVDRGDWLAYDGLRWRSDDGTVAVLRRTTDVATAVDAEVVRCEDDNRRKALRSWATTAGEEPRRRRMIELARAELGIGVRAGSLDADPWLLVVANGTLDLRAGRLRAHRRQDLATRLAPTVYDPAARSTVFADFLERVLPDAELRDYVQRVAGYSLTGLTTEERWFLVYGPPASGKSTLLEALRRTLGDYSATVSSDAFTRHRSGGASPEVARIDGVRLVTASEVTGGRSVDEALVKSLTGGDTIVARELYRQPVTFRPQCKLLVACNDRPSIRADDDAMWRRVLELPFNVSIPEEERDPAVKATLLDVERSGPAILAWAVRGCLAWQRDGLAPPASVRAATADYRSEMDDVGLFLAERCMRHPDGWTSTERLFNAFTEWASTNGITRPMTARGFGRRLARLGLNAESDPNSHRARGWRGVVIPEVASNWRTAT